MQKTRTESAGRHLFLFCEDTVLRMDIEAITKQKGIGLTIQTRLKTQAIATPKSMIAYLVHLHPDRHWPLAIVEELIKQDRQVGQQILLISEASDNSKTHELINKYQLRGYVPRSLIHSMIVSRIESLFDKSQAFRVHERISTKLPVHYSSFKGDVLGLCTSFSEGGMFIQAQSSAIPKEGVPVSVKFVVPKLQKQAELMSRTIYSVPVGFAIRFEKNVPHLMQVMR